MSIVELQIEKYISGREKPTKVYEASAWNIKAMPGRGIVIQFDDGETKGGEETWRQVVVTAAQLSELGFFEDLP